MRTLDRKLARDLWHMRGQAFTIALVVAAGLGVFVAQLVTYESLQFSRESYYAAGRFADVFAAVKRAPNSAERGIQALPGVAEVETTVAFDVTLDLPEVAQPVTGRMIGIRDGRAPRLNRLTLRQGRFLDPGRGNEVLVSEAFAKARGLKPGDRLAAILNGAREQLVIVGVALSPEYIFSTRGGVLPDDRGFGVFWMDGEQLASAFNMEGGFNQVAVRLAPGARQEAVIDALDRLLEPYGAIGAHGREDQSSHKILDQEISQQKTMATVFPTIFLGVAAFLLNVVLARQVATQREQIAALKSLGYEDRTIAAHYLKLALAITGVGIVLGIALGWWLGYRLTVLYSEFFHFPRFVFRVEPWVLLVGSGVSLAAAAGGALGTVRGVMRLAPAEAMRPPAPARYRRMLVERLGMEAMFSSQARMVIRSLERRFLRSLLTTLGIACSVAIIVSGTFWRDAVEYIIAVQFEALERGDATVVFTEPVNGRARYEVERLPGVLYAEPSRSVPVRLRAGHRSYRTAISGLPPDARLRRLLDAELRGVPLPPDGLLLSDRLAQRLGVRQGDRLRVESLEGKRPRRELVVAGVVRDLMGLSAYMDIGALNRMMNEGDSISALAVALDGARAEAFYRRLKEMPAVATVSIKAAMLETFEATSARNILVFTTIITVFAAAIAVGVVYNSARISLAERAWELASLRVLGFSRAEVSGLLLGELAVELAFAIPLGLGLGYLLSWALVELTHTELMQVPLVILPRTYAYAALATLLAGIVSALIVRHRVDHLDLVAVLKVRE